MNVFALNAHRNQAAVSTAARLIGAGRGGLSRGFKANESRYRTRLPDLLDTGSNGHVAGFGRLPGLGPTPGVSVDTGSGFTLPTQQEGSSDISTPNLTTGPRSDSFSVSPNLFNKIQNVRCPPMMTLESQPGGGSVCVPIRLNALPDVGTSRAQQTAGFNKWWLLAGAAGLAVAYVLYRGRS